MNSTRVSELVREYVSPIPQFPAGTTSAAMVQSFKKDIKVEDVVVFNNIRLRAKVVSLISSMEEAERFIKLKDRLNSRFVSELYKILSNDTTPTEKQS